MTAMFFFSLKSSLDRNATILLRLGKNKDSTPWAYGFTVQLTAELRETEAGVGGRCDTCPG
jgi:hypothetical protein